PPTGSSAANTPYHDVFMCISPNCRHTRTLTRYAHKHSWRRLSIALAHGRAARRRPPLAARHLAPLLEQRSQELQTLVRRRHRIPHPLHEARPTALVPLSADALTVAAPR